MAEREFSSLSRVKPYRDARSIIIATEGEATEPLYFEELAQNDRFRHPSIEIKVLPTKHGRSAPRHVIRRLDEIRRQHGIYEGDELWLVIDKDRWGDAQLSQIAQLASQKDYKIADSNPCFELWLVLHFKSLFELDDYICEAEAIKCSDVTNWLKEEECDPSFNKAEYETSKYYDRIRTGIKNARQTDIRSDDRFLNQIGSRVYRLVESIIDSSPNNPSH